MSKVNAAYDATKSNMGQQIDLFDSVVTGPMPQAVKDQFLVTLGDEVVRVFEY